ncbi:MAG: phage major capsid protein [Clostridiales bacterium]|nr:phage major capsid protein [Clostridiales bacterium]
MVTMQSADNALKTLYLGVVTEQLNTGVNPLLAAIKKTETDVWGKEIRRVASYGVNGGVGAGSEEGDLPSANGNNYEQFVLSLKNLYGRIEISDKAVRASENNAGAFVNLLNAEMEGLVKASSFNFGRMLFGDGTGTLCTLSKEGSVITASSVKNLMEGMCVDVRNATGIVSGCNAVRITSVDRATGAITFDRNITASVTTGNTLTVQGSFNKEITGLGAIFKSTGSLYGLDRATHKWMIPYMKGSVGAITEGEILKAVDYLEETADSKVNLIVCSSGVKRALIQAIVASGETPVYQTVAGGFKAVMVSGIPVVSDRFCPAGTMYLLNTEDFVLHQLCDWQFLEGEDGKILKQVAGKPVYTATLVKYADLLCLKPVGQGMLSGITEA